MKKDVALVVSGGGSKGAFAVGAIDVLKEHYDFGLVSGTSTGALIAPMVVIGEFDRLVEIYTSVKDKDILRSNWRKLWWNALKDTKPLEKLIRREISAGGRYERLMESDVDVLLCSVSMQTKELRYYSQRERIPGAIAWRDKEEFVKCVLASTNQPTFTPVVDVRGEQHVDGGVREVVPLSAVEDAGFGEVLVIANHPEPSLQTQHSGKRYNNLMTIGVRTLDLMGTEISLNDVRAVKRYHDALGLLNDAYDRASGLLSQDDLDYVFGDIDSMDFPIDISVIRPAEGLPSDGLKFDPKVMTEMMELGREAARNFLQEHGSQP
jgi:predicted acylesterase/phospholipase RssA